MLLTAAKANDESQLLKSGEVTTSLLSLLPSAFLGLDVELIGCELRPEAEGQGLCAAQNVK